MLALHGCSDPEKARVKQTTKPTYDASSGKLTQLTFDRNKNGVIDTWTDMDGAKPLRSRIDLDEDGTLDRWEYYDAAGALVKVGFSRNHHGKPDAWAVAGSGGRIDRVEISSTGDEAQIDRWERYDASKSVDAGEGFGTLVSAEEDASGDRRPDKWETYENGAIKTVSFDENGDGKPDRRLTYAGGRLATIESAPDGSGKYTKRVDVP